MDDQKPRSMNDIRSSRPIGQPVQRPVTPAPEQPIVPAVPVPKPKRAKQAAAEILPPSENLLDMPTPKPRRKGRVLTVLFSLLIVAATLAAGYYIYLKFFR